MRIRLWLLCFWSLLCLWVQAETTTDKIIAEVQAFEAKTGATVGMRVEVAKTATPVLDYRGDEALIPASNLKLLTSAVALDLLGPEYRFSTDFLGIEKEPGVLSCLLVRASGDPSYRKPFYRDALQPFRRVAQQLKSQGIYKIEHIVIDASLFDKEFRPKGWHKRYLLDGYAAPVGAFSLNDNMVDVVVRGEKVTFEPASRGLRAKLRWSSGPYRPSIWREGDSNIIEVGGTTDGRSQGRRRLTVGNPVTFTGGALWRCFKAEGIVLTGDLHYGRSLQEAGIPVSGGLKNYCRLLSPTLFRLLEAVNQKSDNVIANHLFKKIGAQVKGTGTQAFSESVVQRFLQKAGIDTDGFVQVDGSGLSELNRIKPRQVTGLLNFMFFHRWQDYYRATLASPGVGTLRRRLKGLPVEAKTGTLNHVSALSGYTVTNYGQTLSFSILVNDVPSTGSARALQDRIVKRLAACSKPLGGIK